MNNVVSTQESNKKKELEEKFRIESQAYVHTHISEYVFVFKSMFMRFYVLQSMRAMLKFGCDLGILQTLVCNAPRTWPIL